jgi:hypothetical protein
MSDAPVKTYVLRGNLNKLTNEKYLTYNFVNSECRLGLWKICVLNVGFECLVDKKTNPTINEFVQISSNFVTDHKVENSIVVNYSPALADFLMKANKAEKKLIVFDKTWFYVNCPGEQLRLSFSNSLNGSVLDSFNVNIFITVLLQQIK